MRTMGRARLAISMFRNNFLGSHLRATGLEGSELMEEMGSKIVVGRENDASHMRKEYRMYNVVSLSP